MEELYKETIDLPQYPEKRTRPAFLTTICILTFVGSFFAIIGSCFSLVVFKLIRDVSNNLSSAMDEENKMADFYNWTMIHNYSTIVGSVLCVVGAILMLKLRTSGFWIYIAGQGMTIVTTVLLAFAFANLTERSESIFLQLINVVITAGFIVMYAVNKKHLGKPVEKYEEI